MKSFTFLITLALCACSAADLSRIKDPLIVGQAVRDIYKMSLYDRYDGITDDFAISALNQNSLCADYDIVNATKKHIKLRCFPFYQRPSSECNLYNRCLHLLINESIRGSDFLYPDLVKVVIAPCDIFPKYNSDEFLATGITTLSSKEIISALNCNKSIPYDRVVIESERSRDEIRIQIK
jgi:hypothetical protein